MRDLEFEGAFRPQDYGFDFAFGVGAPIDPSYGSYQVNEVHSYLTNEILPNGERNRVKETRSIALTECGNQLFNLDNKENVKLYGIDKMMCVKDRDSYKIEGEYYSTHFRYLEVKILKCVPSYSKVPCKSTSQIDAFFNSKMFSLAFVNAFFDFQNYKKPISQFLDDSVFFHLETDREKKANVYIMNCEVGL
jgi:hypothetical protein